MLKREVPLKDAQVIAQQQAEITAKALKEKQAAKKSNKKQATNKNSGKDKKEGEADRSHSKSKHHNVKKEVEENPFKKLIDVSDLMEIEQNSEEVSKEV